MNRPDQADEILKEVRAMNNVIPSRSPLEITKTRRIGFLIFPGCDILDLCGPFDAFHYAYYWLGDYTLDSLTISS